MKFWIIVTVPLAFFVNSANWSNLCLYTVYFSNFESDIPLYVTVIYTVIPAVLGGFIFGTPFFLIAKQIPSTNILKRISDHNGRDLSLLMSQHQGSSKCPLSSIWIRQCDVGSDSMLFDFGGLYCSAISISGDTKLRQFIKDPYRSNQDSRQYRFCRNERTVLK